MNKHLGKETDFEVKSFERQKTSKKVKKLLTKSTKFDKISIVPETGGKQETRETKNFQKNKKVVDKAKNL